MSAFRSIDIDIPANEEELRAHRRIADHSFSPSPPLQTDIAFALRQGIRNFRLARVDGRIAGGLGIMPMGQWFGGRSVPLAAINSVAIAPEYRSAGIASRLLVRMLEDVRDQGLYLSVLYPSTQPVYRRAGYEQAGVAMSYKHPLYALDTRNRSLDIRRADRSDEPALRDLYARRAASTSGNLDRSDLMWRDVFEREKTVVNIYTVERDSVPEGYITYYQEESGTGSERNIIATDLVALTPDAYRRLISFIADHRSVVDNFVWMGSPADPIFYHIANQEYEVTDYEQWMLRIVDVAGALEARGYPEMLSAEVHLQVRDNVLGWNNDRFLLSIRDGKPTVSRGGSGRVSIDVRGLASLYAGYVSPLELGSSGYIEASDRDLATLGLVFGGPIPWMAEGF